MTWVEDIRKEEDPIRMTTGVGFYSEVTVRGREEDRSGRPQVAKGR